MACKRSAVRARYPPLHKALNRNGLGLFLLAFSVPLFETFQDFSTPIGMLRVEPKVVQDGTKL